MKNLVIVESPTKAKTLGRFLGADYSVIASMGHIRDIPSNKMNIDIEHDFEPSYEISKGKEKTVRQIESLAKKANEIYLATDPDREGEAIAYHIKHIIDQAIKGKKKFKRITFHQITKAAVDEAMAHAGDVDTKLVDAQQARRVLDRLVGYSLSPVLWRKVRRGLSAGRVQSVALRLVVEREREIEAFKPQEYWEIKVQVLPQGKAASQKFWIDLYKIDGHNIVTGKGDERKFKVNSDQSAAEIVSQLKTANYQIVDVIRKERRRSPKPAYTTSTLQQVAANSLGFTAKRTMSVAQQLYEEGLITYHRTDSTVLSNEAITMARDYISANYGPEYVPDKPRLYQTKSKSAQEAHEAIRPTDVSSKANQLQGVDASAKKLYDLIWKRLVSCQMVDAVYDATTIEVEASGTKKYGLKANGSIMKFAGWRKVYVSHKPQATNHKLDSQIASEDVILPEVEVGEKLAYQDLLSEQKFTQPPPRYNDASIVKILESLGIGRPSTYAPTISTLITRGYMERIERKFVPTPVGMTVTDFLVKNFDEILDYGFTAQMEADLDKIAEGKKEWVPMMKQFWKPFDQKVSKVVDKADRVQVPVEKTGEKCPVCGLSDKGEVVIRTGKFGKFLSCSRFPECKYTGKYVETVDDLKCEKCHQGMVAVKKTRTGRTFYGCSRYPDCDWASWTKPGQEKKN